MQLDISKLEQRKGLVIDITKELGISEVVARVVLAMDYSISMSPHYKSGLVQKVLERILPLGLKFDDNGEVEFYIFHDGVIKLNQSLTVSTTGGYINENVVNKYHMGGTNYEPSINAIVADATGQTFVGTVKNMFGSFFGGGDTKKEQTLPTYVIYITDGDTSNKSGVERAIINASGKPVFFSFVGIGNDRFSFLEKLDDLPGRVIDNASFFAVKDIDKMTDDQLYRLLMKEFPLWITKAKSAQILK